jgi:SAM-dependent methyltransferase
MGYIFNSNDAAVEEKWFDEPKNKSAIDLEERLIINLIRPLRGETVLDIGCGTGANLLPFIEKGLSVTGLDPSRSMLDIASKKLGNRADLHIGFAEDLPFDDNSFHHACLIRTLEFAEDPWKAVAEACRVAKNSIFIGLLNRYSLRVTRLRVARIFTRSVYNHAYFFSLCELKQMIKTISGDVPVSWRTICHFSRANGTISRKIESSELLQRCPFGAYAGMSVTLVPRFRTRPLELPCESETPSGAVAGLARTKCSEK